MRKALINYVNYCAKGIFCRFQDPQAHCVCVAAAAGVFFSWKNTLLDFRSMYLVDLVDFYRFLWMFVDFRVSGLVFLVSGLEHKNCERLYKSARSALLRTRELRKVYSGRRVFPVASPIFPLKGRQEPGVY